MSDRKLKVYISTDRRNQMFARTVSKMLRDSGGFEVLSPWVNGSGYKDFLDTVTECLYDINRSELFVSLYPWSDESRNEVTYALGRGIPSICVMDSNVSGRITKMGRENCAEFFPIASYSVFGTNVHEMDSSSVQGLNVITNSVEDMIRVSEYIGHRILKGLYAPQRVLYVDKHVGIPEDWTYDDKLDLYYRVYGLLTKAVVSCSSDYKYWSWKVMSADTLVGSGWAETLPSATCNADATFRSM